MPKTTQVPVRQDSHRPELRDPGLVSWLRLSSFRNEIDRLLAGFEPRQWFDRPLAMFGDAEAMIPAMDLTENGSHYQISMELPGIDPSKVSVKLANGTLTVSGEKEEETRDAGENYHVSERRWGSFRRSVTIPDHVDSDRIEASHANGVLRIRLPKSAEAKAGERTIQVKAA